MTESAVGLLRQGPSGTRLWLIVLAAFGLLERCALWLVYEPVPFGDTPSYTRLGEVLAGLTLKGYDGTRVPGYPAFLLLAGFDHRRVWLLQMGLGLAISLLLFYMAHRATGSAWVGAAVGAAYDLIPGQVLFEPNVLTETLTTFFVVLSLALLGFVSDQRSWVSQAGVGLALGITSSLAGLVRTLFFFLPPWLVPFVWIGVRGGWRKRLLTSALFCIGPVVLLGGWIHFIYTTYGMISVSTMGGYHMVQHTGTFFDYLPDEVAPIRDTYIKYRDARIAERGDQTNAIWDAIPEMTAVSGLNFYDLSRELQRLSLNLIREHPDLYLRNVVEGWVAFWKAPIYWKPELIASEGARRFLGGLAVLGRVACLVANAVFLGLSLIWAGSRRLTDKMRMDIHLMASAGLVWLISVIQTIVDHGDNPRFLVPLQMVVIYVVVGALWAWMHRSKTLAGVAA